MWQPAELCVCLCVFHCLSGPHVLNRQLPSGPRLVWFLTTYGLRGINMQCQYCERRLLSFLCFTAEPSASMGDSDIPYSPGTGSPCTAAHWKPMPLLIILLQLFSYFSRLSCFRSGLIRWTPFSFCLMSGLQSGASWAITFYISGSQPVETNSTQLSWFRKKK